MSYGFTTEPGSKPWKRNEPTSARSGASVGCRIVSGHRPNGVLPFPAEVAVELLQMVEVVVDADRVVEPAPQIDHHTPLARNAIEQPREIRHVGEVARQLDDEQRQVDAVEIGRER